MRVVNLNNVKSVGVFYYFKLIVKGLEFDQMHCKVRLRSIS